MNSISRPRRRPVVIAALRDALASHELDIHLTEHPGHATVLARQAVAERADIVVVAGGDGTIGEVVNGVIGSAVRMAIIPAGSANDLADYLGIPESIERACALIDHGRVVRMDALWINGRYALTTAGVGIGCETIAWANRIRRFRFAGTHPGRALGHQVYPLAYALATAAEAGRPRPITVRQNGLDIECNALSVTVSNLPRLGHTFLLARDARPDDGLLDICAIENKGRLGATRAAIRAGRGLQSEAPGVRRWRAAQVVIESSRPIPYFADGELMPPSTHFDVRVVSGAVEILGPVKREGR